MKLSKGMKSQGSNLLLFVVSTDKSFKKGDYSFDVDYKLDISYKFFDQIHLKSLKSFNTQFTDQDRILLFLKISQQKI